MTSNRTPIDVWLRFDSDDDEPTYEANTFHNTDGEYVIEWYHTAVGQVGRAWFDTLAEAHAWYETHGYQDFSS